MLIIQLSAQTSRVYFTQTQPVMSNFWQLGFFLFFFLSCNNALKVIIDFKSVFFFFNFLKGHPHKLRLCLKFRDKLAG